jgi:cysteine/O-acetylserine efflux protein
MADSPLLSTSMLQFLAAYMVVVVTPGPIALATGSLASLYGFSRTAPLLAGVGIGTAILATLMALGAVHLAGSLSIPVIKIVGAAALALIALQIARTALPSNAMVEEPRTLQAGLFMGGVLLSLLAPQTASFFAVSFMGLTLPIRNLGEALSVAVIAGVLGVGWYGLLALALSRPSVREVARRSQRIICWAAAASLALMALFSALSAFPFD